MTLHHKPDIAHFENGFRNSAWRVGRNLQMDYRWSGGNPNLIRAYAAELVALKPDALHAFSTPVVVALQQETHTIPIVFQAVSDPVGSRFVDSVAHPGRNATGWTNYVSTFPGKLLSLLKEIVPSIRRAAALFNPITAPYATKFYVPAPESAGRAMAVEVTPAFVREPTDIEKTVLEFAHEPDGGLIVIPDTFTIVHRKLIIALSNQSHLPTIYPYRDVGPAGGLVTYGYDSIEPYRSSADYINRILRGEKAADLPVQAPTEYELLINLKTAKALGLTAPVALLARAVEVIE